MAISLSNIYVGQALLTDADFFSKHLNSKQILIVTDAIVAKLHLPVLLQTLSNCNVENIATVQLPSGEENKNWANVELILATLLRENFDRSATILSLGGGLVGDIAGFAASLYMRGINWLQIPTTLLAQVDSAVGGKTGCNYLGVKNLIGAYYFPLAILVDINLLKTLPEREYKAGLAEVVKYGFVCDADFFIWLETNTTAIKQLDAKTVEYMVSQCCTIKHEIVQQDAFDQKQRLILNFGHSFAHALEAATGFKYYLHGEAVAIGMLLASHLAVKIGLLEQHILDRLVNLLAQLGLNVHWDKQLCAPDMLINYMRHDKKTQAGIRRLILPCELGKAEIVPEQDVHVIEGVLQNYG